MHGHVCSSEGFCCRVEVGVALEEWPLASLGIGSEGTSSNMLVFGTWSPVPPHPPDSANHTTTFLDKSPQVRMQRYLVHSPGLHTLGQPAAVT